MGATLYKEHKVFTLELGLTEDGRKLNQAVIVASEKCDKNCYPHIYHWGIDFIGGTTAFWKEYLPQTGKLFTNGNSQSPDIADETAFVDHLEGLFLMSRPLTVKDLKEIGFHGYSWSKERGACLSDRSSLTLIDTWLGERYAAPLRSSDDVEKMVRQALEIMDQSDNGPWLPDLWPISRESMAVLNQPLSDDRQVTL